MKHTHIKNSIIIKLYLVSFLTILLVPILVLGLFIYTTFAGKERNKALDNALVMPQAKCNYAVSRKNANICLYKKKN